MGTQPTTRARVDSCAVLANVDLGEGWYRLEIEAPHLAPLIAAGQFLQVRIGDGDDPLIRRPFSVYDLKPEPGPDAHQVDLLVQVVGPVTRTMAALRAGDPIDLLGPLGNPMPGPEVGDDGLLLLVGGGIGVAPLFLYCRELAQTPGSPRHRVLLGARRRSLLIGEEGFVDLGVDTAVATDDGSRGHHGTVVDLLGQHLDGAAGVTVAGIGCGPHGMNVALRDLAVRRQLPFWISLENYMPCGFGACFGCVIATPEGQPLRYRRVCVDGPTFRADDLPERF